MAKPSLTVRQRLFVEAYIADATHSGKAAAIAAGYSTRRAHVTASLLLRKAHVRAAIDRALRPQLRRYGLTKRRVLRELATLAFSDVLDYSDGQLALTGGAAKRASRAVSSVRTRTVTRGVGAHAVTERTVEVKLWDKNRALELAMKHLRLLVERVEVDEATSRQSTEEIRESLYRKLQRIAEEAARESGAPASPLRAP